MLAFDFQRFQAPLGKLGLKFSTTPAQWPMTLAPQKDGKWRVTQSDDFDFSVTTPSDKIDAKSEGVSFEGLFDPALPGFVSAVSVVKKTTADDTKFSVNALSPVSSTVTNDMRSESHAVASGAGVQSVTFHQTVHDKTQHIVVDVPAKAGENNDKKPAPFALDVNFGESTTDGKIDGLRARAILDLWTFLLAHSGDPAKDAPDELKTRLRAALPLFDRLGVDASMKKIAATTPLGQLAAGELDVKMGLNGLRSDGAFDQKLAAKEIALPAAMLPAWANGLAPTDIAWDIKATGFDPAGAVEVLIASLGSGGPGKPEIDAELLRKLLPNGDADVKLTDMRLASKLYELKIDALIKPSLERKTTLTATIVGKGLDVALKALAAAGKSDKDALQAWLSLQIATALAKPGPNGTLVWEIALPADGNLTVNGAPLGKMGQKP